MSKFDKGTSREQAEVLALIDIVRGDAPGGDGDRAASRLFGRYQRNIYLWCFRYVGEHERALELAQEVLLRAHRKLDLYQGRSSFGTWLFSVTRNICINEMKRSRLRQADVDLELLPDDRENPEEALLRKLGEDRLLGLVRETLEPLEQQALWLRCVELLPVDEITRILGITESTGARSLLQNTRRKLRVARERIERKERGERS